MRPHIWIGYRKLEVLQQTQTLQNSSGRKRWKMYPLIFMPHLHQMHECHTALLQHSLLNFSTSASSSHNSGKGWLPIDRKISKDFPSAEEAAIQWAAGQIIVQCLLWGQLCNCFDVVADMEVQMRVGGVKELQVTEHKAAAGGSNTGLSLWRPWGEERRGWHCSNVTSFLSGPASHITSHQQHNNQHPRTWTRLAAAAL